MVGEELGLILIYRKSDGTSLELVRFGSGARCNDRRRAGKAEETGSLIVLRGSHVKVPLEHAAGLALLRLPAPRSQGNSLFLHLGARLRASFSCNEEKLLNGMRRNRVPMLSIEGRSPTAVRFWSQIRGQRRQSP